MPKINIKSFFGDKAFYKQVTGIALPIMAQQFITSFVNLIDNIMVGGLGETALTAVSVSTRFYLIALSVLFGLSGAAGIFIAQNFGAERHDRCQKLLNINLVLSCAAMALFTAVLVVAPEWALNLFSRTPDIVQSGMDYIYYARFTYIPYAISFVCMMAMQAIGLNKIQLKVGAVAVLTNTALNYVLIYGHFGAPAMGVKGAALATLIARLFEMCIYIVLLLRKKHYFRLDIKGLLFLDLSLMKRLVVKAIPLTANELIYSIGTSMIFKAYMRIDELLVAAIAVVDTVINLAFIVFGGLSSAIAIFIGGKLGAGKIEEAKQDAKKIVVYGIAVAIVLGGIVFLIAPYIHYMYDLSDQAAQALKIMIRIKSCIMPAYVVNVCTFFTLRAGGDVWSTLIMDSVFLWACPVTIATLLSIFSPIGVVELFVFIEGLEYVKCFLSYSLLKRGKWAKNLTQ